MNEYSKIQLIGLPVFGHQYVGGHSNHSSKSQELDTASTPIFKG